MHAPSPSPSPTPDGLASPIDVAAGLVREANRLLIAQRPPGSHLAGLWEFPGGKRELGESWEDCLRRELLEELGIQVEVGSTYEEITHTYPAKVVRLRFLCARLRPASGPARPLGCAAFAWITRDELDRYTFPPADSALLARLADDDSFWSASGPLPEPPAKKS